MDEWAYDLAKTIKKNKPQKITGPCIGDTVSVSPFQVKILNGSVILNSKNAYVCRQLLERKSKFKASGSSLEQSGSLNAACAVGSHTDYSASGQFTQEGDIELDTVWKAGDKVLVVPSGDGQSFFIVDILEV